MSKRNKATVVGYGEYACPTDAAHGPLLYLEHVPGGRPYHCPHADHVRHTPMTRMMFTADEAESGVVK